MNVSVALFCARSLERGSIRGKAVVEIGACNVNGSVQPYLKSFFPKKYIGVDIANGPGVDVVCRVEDLVSHFGKNSFDVVIATELLEHVLDWRSAISNIKQVCKPNGIIVLTTRSEGFPYHGYPLDFWRYSQADIERIFSDCKIDSIEKDPEMPGIFVKIMKPANFSEKDMGGISLYSINAGKRVDSLDEAARVSFKVRCANRAMIILRWVKDAIFSTGASG